jgi:uncharacterized lipoprotein
MKKFYVVTALMMLPLLLTAGCSTIADARNSKGQGMSRVYDAPFNTVWTTVPKALNNLGLSVAGENKEEGYILAQKGMTAFSYGENIAVFVNKVNENQTKVEVVSKKSMSTNVFAWDWQKPVLDKLSEMLEKK